MSKEMKKEEAVVKEQSEDLLAEAILRAESLDLRGAREMLKTILRHNPRDVEAWLWFSRVAGNMKIIEKSLENASKIAPDKRELIEESRKIQAGLKSGCPEEGEVKHCPFCWTPITESFAACPYCKAHYFIDSCLFNSPLHPDEEILTKAVLVFRRLVLQGKKNETYFYLALAYANLGKLDKAIDILETIIENEPESETYKLQLKNLQEHVARLQAAGVDAESVKEVHAASMASVASDGRKKILVVDDSAVTRKVVRGLFTQDGFEVIEAKNGFEAIEYFKETTPDLVLLDIIMPKMDGYEVLAILKKDSVLKNVPVIMLTARDSLMDKLRGKMSASDEYLTKPFTPEELLAKVKKYVE